MSESSRADRAIPNELDALRALDPHTLARLHDQHFPAIYRYARFRLGDHQLAEDLASEVFVRLIESLQRGQGPRTTVQGWLMATAANLASDHYRRVYRQPQDELGEHLPEEGPQPDQLASERELHRELQLALDDLTPDQQHVIAMRFGAGYTLEQTALALARDVNAIKALQFRALAALRRTMGDGRP